jgi:arginase
LERSTISSVPVAQIPDSLRAVLATAPLGDTLGYLHVDLDVLDPRVGQANWFPVDGGLSVEQLTGAITEIRDRVPLGAAALTSYGPEYDTDQAVCRAAFAVIDAIVSNCA